MAKDFDQLANRVKTGWSDEAHALYDAASESFSAEARGRKDLGKALAMARKERSLTQPELSKLSGIQQSEISKIERGVSNPTAETLLRLGAALGQRLSFVPEV